MYRKLTIAIGVLLGTTIWVFDAVAQDPVTFERPAAVASLISEAPTIDGEVLDGPAWIGFAPTSGFIQKTPDTGHPGSERTEVYIAYTGDTLYFGVVCCDREPNKIVVADSRRDSELVETDSFQIILDTYRDEQTGFVFGTNPVGIEYDGQVTREGEGSAFSAGDFNKNWDAVWEVSAHTSDIGWSAEFAIPFTTLRSEFVRRAAALPASSHAPLLGHGCPRQETRAIREPERNDP